MAIFPPLGLADFVLDGGVLKNTGPEVYEASVISSAGEQEIGVFPAGTEIPAPAGHFTLAYRETPGGPIRKRAFGAEGKGAEPQAAGKATYRYLTADLDTSASRWLDDETYLLVVETKPPAVVRVFSREPVAAEMRLTSAGPEERYRMATSALRVWGASEQRSGPGERAYFFLGTQGAGPYRVFIQAERDGRVSRPIVFSFDRPARVRTQ